MVAAVSLPRATAHRSAFASLLLGAGLAITLVAAVAGRSDWLQLRFDTVWTLNPAEMQSEKGHAWMAKLPESVPRLPPGQGNAMQVCVDGVPMTMDNHHSLIREQGGGIVSIWGKWVYLSTRDGSDPTSNGRQYSVVLPEGTESPAGPMVMRSLGLGLILVLLGLMLRPTVLRILFSLAVLAVPAIPAYAFLRDHDWSQDLALGQQEFDASHEPLAAAASRPMGNTRRLMSPDAPLAFQLTGSPAKVRQPVRIAFTAEDCLQGKDGVFRLLDNQCCLVGHPDREMNAPDVGELVLTVRILEGDTLSIEWIQQHDGNKHLPDIVLPVRASPDWQTLRITDPLGMYLGTSAVPLQGFRLGNGAPGSPLVMEVGELIATDRRSLYTRAPSGHGPFERGQHRRPAHWQSAAGTFRLPWPQDGGRLLKGALCALTPGTESPIRFELFWEDAQGTRHSLHEGGLAEKDDWRDLALRVPDDAEPVALLFEASSLPDDGVLAWAGWRLVDDSRPPRRIFLTIMDTLRADGLSSYGGDSARTPELDALADNGVRFSNAVSQCYWTRPSMASMMTGHYVPATGVHSELDQLPQSFETLAEVFAQGGFYTAAYITNTNAGPVSGLDQGWDEQLLKIKRQPYDNGAAFIEAFVDPASERLLEEDLLFYVHLMDAHGPYGPSRRPSDWTSPGGRPVPRDPSLDWPWLKQPTDAARVQLYYSSVETLDETWGALLGRLRSRWDTPGAQAPVVAVAADHGEYLGEYGLWSHIYHELTPELVHVPLIIEAPGQLPSGAVISSPVENIDLAPTLLELAGLPSSRLSQAAGRSLVGLSRDGESSEHGLAFSSAYLDDGIFASYSESGGILGRKQAIIGMTIRGEASYQDMDEILGADLLGRWITTRTTSGFLDTWSTFLTTRLAIREAFWKDVDESATQLDPGAIEQLRQMGYLR